ncbi:MAG: tellurite resistance TerB family protein [Synechococcaceae cyanobacterium]|nr:tellurite resistance TerB family protein [Synechococcaceae cyanobacterium]
MTPSEAFAAVALVSVSCDGSLSREEARALRSQLEGRSPYRELSEQAMGDLFDRLLERLRQEGWRALLSAAIGQLTPPQQETALAMAVHLVHCDRSVEPQEQELLEDMASQLDLSAERSRLIIDVIGVLNRDSLAA